MNRGVLQSSSAATVQQMMGGGSPNWWNMINTMRPPLPNHNLHHHHQQPPLPPPPPPPSPLPPFLAPLPSLFPSPPPPTAASPSLPFSSSSWSDSNQEHLPVESWSQLLLGGLVGEEEKSLSVVKSKLENWEHQLLAHQSSNGGLVFDVKQETTTNNTTTPYDVVYGSSSSELFPPKSCVTSLSNNNNNNSNSNMLDFSNKSDARHPHPSDHSSECNSTATGGAPITKKPRIQPSSTQSTFKVRKEKLGDRITALHQLVSPFGKTDTASVLLEAIGYIRFLQSQIEALSLPYLGNGSGNNNMRHHQQPPQPFVQADRSCLFPEDPGQLLNDNCMKRKGTSDHPQQQDCNEEPKKDLRTRGLCLVPISCTIEVGTDNINGADYWAPAAGGGGFRS